MTIVAINPATGVELARFEEASPTEIDSALARAHETFRAWRERPLVERCVHIMRVGDLLRTNRQELAALATAEMGKQLTEARAEVEKAAGFCDHYATKAEEYLAPRRLDGGHDENWLYYEPLGPILAVMPWSFPYVQVFRFAPAILVAGKVVVLKHASVVPQCALRIEALFKEAGFPAGAFQTLLVGPAAVEDILSDHRIRGVTLTGSEGAGSNVASVAGRELKTSVMELGGSDPFIVLEDADVALTAAAARKSRFSNNGQACINAKRFIVVEECADQFEKALVEQVQTLRVGDPMDPATTLGPLARKEFVHSLCEQVEESIHAGAKLRTGGFDHPGQGAFVDPIVLTAVTPNMRVFREETFGPVAAVVRGPDEQAAIELANASNYGLGASVWTADVERGRQIALELESGMVFINDVVVSDVRLPCGGRKRSGYGRELGEWGLREFTEIKSIAVARHPATVQPTAALTPSAVVE